MAIRVTDVRIHVVATSTFYTYRAGALIMRFKDLGLKDCLNLKYGNIVKLMPDMANLLIKMWLVENAEARISRN